MSLWDWFRARARPKPCPGYVLDPVDGVTYCVDELLYAPNGELITPGENRRRYIGGPPSYAQLRALDPTRLTQAGAGLAPLSGGRTAPGPAAPRPLPGFGGSYAPRDIGGELAGAAAVPDAMTRRDEEKMRRRMVYLVALAALVAYLVAARRMM